MNRNFLISAVFVLVLSTTALGYEGQDIFGEYAIMIGEPTIDGVISPGEWDSANWLDLDQVYNGDPRDLSEAKWAALWSPETNRIYVVVTGTDTEHTFGDFYGDLGWNKYDQAEVYVDIGNNETTTYYFEGYQVREPAHQWMCGNDNYGGSWVVQPEEFTEPDPPPPLPEEIRPLLVTSIDDDVLTYELAIPPYEWIGWLTDETMNLMELETDIRIGLDVIMSSKGTSFGMLCENAYDGNDLGPDGIPDTEDDGIITIDKWQYAERYLDHSLIADPNQAWRPRPANKAMDMPRDVTLQWNAGRDANEHDVYFGTSFDDVDNATDPNLGPVGKGRQALGNRTYTPDEIPLDLDRTYYWRIDEVNGLTTVKGNIWSLTTIDYAVVEDFDSYASTIEITGDGGSIPTIWADYYTNDTCAELALETDIVRDGNSLNYYYGNDADPYHSEAKANIVDLAADDPNWAACEIKALSLWFYGQFDNSTDANDGMYLALEDTGGNLAVVPYDGDADDLKLEAWQEWNIALEDFNEVNNVDISSIASIYIGFGDRYDPAGVGDGTVYFDDIRLYLSRCIPARAKGDATGDCIANFEELIIMAGDWLESEFTVPVSEPNEEGLLIWYRFDNDGAPSTAVDSSIPGYDGTVSDADWTTEGHIDGALNFDGITTQVVVPLAALTNITTKVTIALWQYGNPEIQPKADNLFEGTRTHEGEDPNGIRVINAHVPYSDEMIVWCAGNPNDAYDANVWADCERIEKKGIPKEYEGRWNHWTFIKDCNANDDTGELRMYLNGLLWDIGYDVNVPLTDTINKEFLIGNGFDGYYAGIIDDFRIYNKVLTQEEIAYLATKGTGYYLLQDREANFNEEGESAEKIDFMDFAHIADYWFEVQLWP